MGVLVNMLPRSHEYIPRWYVLRAWRRALGLSLKEIGELLGLTISGVQKREISPSKKHFRDKKKKREWAQRNKTSVRNSYTKWANKNKQWIKDYNRKWSKEHAAERNTYSSLPSVFLNRLMGNAKARAIKNNLAFDVEALKRLIEVPPSDCVCCGSKLDYRCGVKGKGGDGIKNSPSIDRIQNDLGYSDGNIAIICLRCNRLKNNATVDEVSRVLRYMKRENT